MKRYKTIVQLINPTKKKWVLFKSIERKIVNLVKTHGVTIIKTVNDDELFIKTIIFDDFNEGENNTVIFEVGNFLGSHNIKINIISMIEIFPIKKIKYKIGLLNPTPKKWKLFKSMELHIKKHAEEEKVIREDVKYDNKNQTLSVVASYPNELARTKMENKITLCLKGFGLERHYKEAIEFKDYSDDIIDLPFYNANKLIDQAEQSLDKLSHM